MRKTFTGQVDLLEQENLLTPIQCSLERIETSPHIKTKIELTTDMTFEEATKMAEVFKNRRDCKLTFDYCNGKTTIQF